LETKCTAGFEHETFRVVAKLLNQLRYPPPFQVFTRLGEEAVRRDQLLPGP
jgi:hypothetical protein